MKDILSANQTARIIGCAPQMVRERIKRGIWTFGTVVTAKEAGNTQNSYEINKRALAEWLKIPPESLDTYMSFGRHCMMANMRSLILVLGMLRTGRLSR